MAKIVRYNGNLVPFASSSLGTERTIFGQVTQANDITSQFTPQFLRGWGIVGPSDQPTLQDFNAVSYTHGQLLAYLHQIGIAEYNSAQEYHLGSFAGVSGVLYVSLANTNTGNAPATSPASWKKVSSGSLIGVRVFTSNTIYTETPGTKKVLVKVQGAGGAGGGAAATGAGAVSVGSGGTAGSYSEGLFSTGFSGVTITVGIGGTPVSGTNGNAGGASSFGGLISAPGGIGGIRVGPTSPPTGTGTGSPTVSTGGNIINTIGAPGGIAFAMSTTLMFGGIGGASVLGGGGNINNTGSTPSGGVGFGGGGGGASQLSSAGALPGGAGAPGVVIVMEFE